MNPFRPSLYSLQKAHLEYSYPCDIIDTGHGCEQMNYSRKPFVWCEIAPDNQMGTHRGPSPYLVGNSPYVTIYGHGIPH